MTTLLIVAVLIIGTLALIQLVRVFELSAKLRGTVSEVPTLNENKNQARMMIVLMIAYFGFFAWLLMDNWDKMLPVAASAHGVILDKLLDFNFLVIIFVFIITHIFLFYFAYKYYYRPERKATYFTHSNKLELIWTIIPALFLAVIIFYGLSSWNDIMLEDTPDDALNIELYSKQFDWTARYGGKDNTLGAANYNMIGGTNALGLLTTESIKAQLADIDSQIEKTKMKQEGYPEGGKLYLEAGEEVERLKRHRGRVVNLSEQGLQTPEEYATNNDDVVVKGEFHLPVNRNIHFQFRSQDVIHSAYLPHFRVQMNTVPGMITQFNFLPTITTKEMREITGNPDFDYILLCNKICGAAHYNMKMTVVVETEEEYQAWMDEQKQFNGDVVNPKEETPAAEPATAEGTNSESTEDAEAVAEPATGDE